jgi:hypothetical protein
MSRDLNGVRNPCYDPLFEDNTLGFTDVKTEPVDAVEPRGAIYVQACAPAHIAP